MSAEHSKDKKALDRHAIAALIDSIFRESGYLQIPEGLQPPPRYTFAEPHSCLHCCDKAITVHGATLPCSRCVQPATLVDKADPDPDDPDSRCALCGGCGKNMKTESHRHSISDSAVLVCGLEEAAAAAQSGCALYIYMIVSLVSTKNVSRVLGIRLEADSVGGDSVHQRLRAMTFRLDATSQSLGMRRGSLQTLLTFENVRLNKGDALWGWAAANNAAAKYVTTRPHELAVDSAASWHFARHSFQTCQKRHSSCRAKPTDMKYDDWTHGQSGFLESEVTNISDVPAQLVQLSSDSATVRIVNVKDMTEQEKNILCSSGFAILSYCWGRNQSFTLARDRSVEMRDGFETQRVPATVRDAVRTTKELGLGYLWVDALCIYQDSEDDKAAEISRMATYYKSATVTICASAAASCDQGFLHRREELPYAVGPIRLALKFEDGRPCGHIYLADDSLQPTEATATRGWTMQESLLSRRLLIYAQRQVYWNCIAASSGCRGLYDEMTGMQNTSRTVVRDVHPIAVTQRLPIGNMWEKLLISYTARHISVAEDKLVAISALVEHLMAVSRERGETFAYMAGILVGTEDNRSCLNHLLWYTHDPAISLRPRLYRAPSWTWAAVDGPIHPMLMQGAMFDLYDTFAYPWILMAQVTGYAVGLLHQNMPYGGVKSGELEVEGFMQPLSAVMGFCKLPFRLRVHRRSRSTLRSDMSHRMEVLPDTSADAELMTSVLSTYTEPPVADMCLLLLQIRSHGRQSLGLVIVRGDLGGWKRIGIFHSHGGNDSSLPSNDDDIFNGAVFQKVRLV